MFLGLLIVGIGAGAAAAAVWIASGGSLIMGFVLYSLVGTMLVLGIAALSYFISEWREVGELGKAGALHPVV